MIRDSSVNMFIKYYVNNSKTYKIFFSLLLASAFNDIIFISYLGSVQVHFPRIS